MVLDSIQKMRNYYLQLPILKAWMLSPHIVYRKEEISRTMEGVRGCQVIRGCQGEGRGY